MTVRYWRDGRSVAITLDDWARIVPTFLGSGLRVRFPATPDHARAQAEAVAALFGTTFDPAPWADLSGPCEVAGGWVYGLDSNVIGRNPVRPAARVADRRNGKCAPYQRGPRS